MVLVQKWSFFQLLFYRQNMEEKCLLLYYILERKNSFLGYKKKEVQKFEKLPFFPKGLTKGFGPKIAIFPTSFFQAI